MRRDYATAPSPSWHATGGALAVALACTLSVWGGRPVAAAFAACALPLAFTRWRLTAVALVAVALLATAVSGGLWAHPQIDRDCAGWGHVVSTPNSWGLLVIDLDHNRLETVARGSPGGRLSSVDVGEWVWVEGTCSSVGDRRHLARHVVGRLRLRVVGARVDGSPVERSLGWVHRALRSAADHSMPAPVAALFTGLVIGDAGREPAWLSDSFRRSGLAHLQAVSGENLAFLLAASLPFLRALRPAARFMSSLMLVAWFVALTGASASVVRAAVMAVMALAAWTWGYRVHPLRSLCWSVTVIELIDPHLVWSVGFWLSVSATASLITLARPLASLLPGPPRVAQALAVAVAAQVGAAVPSLLVFGSLAPLSIPANLAALPAAGAVMLIGIPSGLAVAVVPLPPAVQRLVMLPACIACRWVLDVARLAAALSPHGWGSVAVWAGQLIVLMALVMVRRLRFRRAILNG